MTSTTSLATAGIMFRTTRPRAAFAMIAETTARGLTFEWRSSAGATAQSVSLAAANAVDQASPQWELLLRVLLHRRHELERDRAHRDGHDGHNGIGRHGGHRG